MICVTSPCRYNARASAEQWTVSFISSDFAWPKYSTGSTYAHGDVEEVFLAASEQKKRGCDATKTHSTRGNSCLSWNTNISFPYTTCNQYILPRTSYSPNAWTYAVRSHRKVNMYLCWCIGREIQCCVENWAHTAAQSMALNFQREWLTDPPLALIQTKDVQDLYIVIYVQMKGLTSVKNRPGLTVQSWFQYNSHPSLESHCQMSFWTFWHEKSARSMCTLTKVNSMNVLIDEWIRTWIMRTLFSSSPKSTWSYKICFHE